MNQNFIFSTGLVHPFEPHDPDRRFFVYPEDRTEFTEYGNQPKVHSVAWNIRVLIEADRITSKRAMKRRTNANGLERVSRRTEVCEEGAWHRKKPFRSLRSWMSAAPKSPAAHWLAQQGYQKFPF